MLETPAHLPPIDFKQSTGDEMAIAGRWRDTKAERASESKSESLESKGQSGRPGVAFGSLNTAALYESSADVST